MAKARQAIRKSIRFEVFKRDSFRCQYCGAEAPKVLLHIDHIKPVVDGGTNDLTNLITSCAACNLGKRDVPLDDHAAVNKSRAQLDELQERREQLELMMQWREGLRDLDQETADRVATYWNEHTPGRSVSDHGKQKIKKWLREFSASEICAAMDAASTQYLTFDDARNTTAESWDRAFNMILGICRVNRASRDEPDLKQLYYIRGILRKRLPGYFDEAKALQYLRNARTWDITVDDLGALARRVTSWTKFCDGIDDMIGRRREELGESDSD